MKVGSKDMLNQKSLTYSEDVSSLASRSIFVHEEHKTCLTISPFSFDSSIESYHSLPPSFFHLKDCPQRRVVSIHSSARLTGSLRHSETRRFAMMIE